MNPLIAYPTQNMEEVDDGSSGADPVGYILVETDEPLYVFDQLDLIEFLENVSEPLRRGGLKQAASTAFSVSLIDMHAKSHLVEPCMDAVDQETVNIVEMPSAGVASQMPRKRDIVLEYDQDYFIIPKSSLERVMGADIALLEVYKKKYE